jgi:hypothetical protein
MNYKESSICKGNSLAINVMGFYVQLGATHNGFLRSFSTVRFLGKIIVPHFQHLVDELSDLVFADFPLVKNKTLEKANYLTGVLLRQWEYIDSFHFDHFSDEVIKAAIDIPS